MFILNQDGDLCLEVSRVSYSLEYSDDIKLELNKIYKNGYSFYHRLSTEQCEREIKREQENYIRNNKIEKEFQIFINGTRFAIIKDHDEGNKIFRFIIESLANKVDLIDLSKIDSYGSKCKKYNIITVCGDVKFEEELLNQQKRLTLEGNIVLFTSPFNFCSTTLDDLDKKKIYMSDEIFVINVGGFVSPKTEDEINYANSLGKKITYMERPIIPV